MILTLGGGARRILEVVGQCSLLGEPQAIQRSHHIKQCGGESGWLGGSAVPIPSTHVRTHTCALEPWEPKLQVYVSWVLGSEPWSSGKQWVLLTSEPFLQAQPLHTEIFYFF